MSVSRIFTSNLLNTDENKRTWFILFYKGNIFSTIPLVVTVVIDFCLNNRGETKLSILKKKKSFNIYRTSNSFPKHNSCGWRENEKQLEVVKNWRDSSVDCKIHSHSDFVWFSNNVCKRNNDNLLWMITRFL